MPNAWLVCLSPVHIGGADSESRGNNNPVFRLPDRTPAIPGSSLRGALREDAEGKDAYRGHVKNWFGGPTEDISPGRISLGWGWPVWWPVHVLGYGNWWVSCPGWLNRFSQLNHGSPFNFAPDQVYMTHPELAAGSSLYLRWLKLTHIQKWTEPLPAPEGVTAECRIVVPDHAINLIVDMGLVRQPRIQLPDNSEEERVDPRLFSIEGYPPGAVFMFSWTVRQKVEHLEEWQSFLQGDHTLGGLWSVGYGNVRIMEIGGA